MAGQTGQRKKPDRLLLVSLDNLGDLVFAAALLPPLREKFPAAHIGVWCKQYAAGLAPLLPAVDSVYSSDPFWDRAPGTEKGSMRRFLEVARSIRRARFDTALLCFAPWRTAAAVAATRIPVRIGLERRRNRRWLTHTLPPEDRTKPVLSQAARLLAPLGITTGPLQYRLDTSRSESLLADVRALLGEGTYVAVHPFAGSEKKCIALGEWIRVARELSQRGASVLWIGTSPELATVRRYEHSDAGWRYSDTLFEGSLTKTALALANCRLFIGHDSGPLHIAAGLGIPTVGVFVGGTQERSHPQGTGPSRMIARFSPNEISAADILREARALDAIPWIWSVQR